MIKRRHKQELGRLLRQYEPSRQMVESDRFWSAFRARAELIQQSQPDHVKKSQRRLWQMEWRFSTVAALVLLVFSLYTLFSTYFVHPPPASRQAPLITLVDQNADISEPDQLQETGTRRMGRSPDPGPIPSDNIPMFTARDNFDGLTPMDRYSMTPMALIEQETACSPPETGLSKIEKLEVAIDYSGLLILHDEEHGGTFILLALTD